MEPDRDAARRAVGARCEGKGVGREGTEERRGRHIRHQEIHVRESRVWGEFWGSETQGGQQAIAEGQMRGLCAEIRGLDISHRLHMGSEHPGHRRSQGQNWILCPCGHCITASCLVSKKAPFILKLTTIVLRGENAPPPIESLQPGSEIGAVQARIQVG